MAMRSARATGSRASARGRTSVRYYICLGLLVATAASLQVVTRQFRVHFQKQEVPLKQPLQLLDIREMAPRYERHPGTDKLPKMSDEMVESLGTEEFTRILIVDTAQERTSRTRLANVFITYYTGRPDMVPHVPDECYLAGGYDKLGVDTVNVPVGGIDAPSDEVPVRVVRFIAPQSNRVSGEEVAVMYFFNVNGAYATTRDGVRAHLSNPFQPYAYYAKVEITFSDELGKKAAAPADSIAALGPLLEGLMPILLEDHLNVELVRSAENSEDGGDN